MFLKSAKKRNVHINVVRITNNTVMVVAMFCMTIMMMFYEDGDDDECLVKLILGHVHNLITENDLD